MTTLGIELSDVGIHAVVINEDGSSRSLNLGKDSERYPAFACVKEGSLVFGPEAQELSMVYPRRACSEFIDDLSFQATVLEGHRGRLTYSQIAYSFFQELVGRIQEEVDNIDHAVLAVPGHYLESNEKSEERLGLLLGIFNDLDIPIAGILDMAAASLYSEGLWHVPEGECIFHVDLLLHATHISVFHKQAGLKRVYFARLPQHGFGKMQERFSGALANRFLQQTAFDVKEDRRIERAFHAQTREMLLHLGRVGEASLEVSTREKSRQMTISKEIVAIDLAPQVKILTQMLLRAVNDFAGKNESIQICLSERAAAIQGLKESIISQGIGQVNELPLESAAFGAANYGKGWEAVNNVEEIRVETGIDLDQLPGSDSDATPPHLGSIRLIQEGRSLNPTHIVCDGLAYDLSKEEFVLGVGESEDYDLMVDRHEGSASFELCRIIKIEDRWVLSDSKEGTIHASSRSGIKAGDALEVTLLGQVKNLLFVHCLV